jgi:probable HAF family extracellular repeat protein
LGGSWSIAQGINDKGQLVGATNLPGDAIFHASLWQNGTVADLVSLEGGPFSITFTNPNNRGEVSGYSNTQTPDPNGEDFCLDGNHLVCLGFVWRDGVMSALPTLGGNNGQAYQINNRGQVAGVAENTTPDPTCSAFNLEAKPVVWQDGKAEELRTIPGDPDGWGYGINDQGQIVGATGTCFANQPAASLHAVMWPNGPGGGVIDLGNLGGTNSNISFYISNQGQVVGMSGVPGNVHWHAFLWTQATGMQDLGTLPGDVESWASNLNSQKQAVGTSFPATGNGRAFIWQNGVISDLNTLIPAGSPLSLLEAFGINDRGEIAGWGQLIKGDHIFHRGFLLTPCEGDNDRM